jgi:hypothetical protein
VRPNGVVVLSPSFDHDLGLLESVEYLSVEQFISQLAIEAFVVAVLPGAAGFNVKGLNTHRGQPLTNGLGRELPAIVRSDILGGAMSDEKLCETKKHIIRSQPSLCHNGQTLTGVFIDDRENLDGPPIMGPGHHKIIGPDMVSVGRSKPDTRSITKPQTTSSGLFLGNLEPLLMPDPFHPFVVNPPPILLQKGCNPTIPVTTILPCKPDNLTPQDLLIPLDDRIISLG